MRVSEEEKNRLCLYATKLGLRLDLAEMLNSTEEIDAALDAIKVIEDWIDPYHWTKSIAPDNSARRRKEFMKLYNQVEDKELLVSEYKALSPLKSQVKDIKHQAIYEAEEILKSTGIGKKRRDMIRPIFHEILKTF